LSPVTDESTELIAALERAVDMALEEDLGDRGIEADVTTTPIVSPTLRGAATLKAKQAGVICGLRTLAIVFRAFDPQMKIDVRIKDGDAIAPGDVLASLEGSARALLIGERTALNLMTHLSGIATFAREFARLAPGIEISDTRKTLPGLRLLEKYAVRTGGGANHRFALWDGILIKDNHIVAAGSIGEAVRRARAGMAMPVQAECETLQQVDEALDAGAMALLLDNRTPDELRELVPHIREKREFAMIEASGGITLENIAAYATTGVDRISIGALTHSAPSLDLSFSLDRVWEPS
jgi:nicotinate-nucleotide pyrophosphorylase (carboxylating)